MKKINYKLLVILSLAALVRFGGLNWCLPYTPHPDEWNMAAAVTRLSWENKQSLMLRNKLNPQFFAYGQFPLYLTYFSAKLYNLIPWITIKEIDTQEAIFFLRFWSALAGVATVYLVYLISKKLTPISHPRPTTHFSPSLLATLLAAFTPGLIQISHFGTTESFLSFFFLLIIYLSFKILENTKARYFVFWGIIFGLSLATKISAFIFIAPILPVFIVLLKRILTKPKKKIKDLFLLLSKFLFAFATSLVFTLITSPHLLLSFHESKRTLLYETAVATGASPVFYTRQFIDTPPILFQLQKIFPYALGWPIFIFGTVGFSIILVRILKKVASRKKLLPFDLNFCLLTFAFLTYFLSQAFLFTKWTRFMAPLFAFFPIFAAILLSYLRNLRYLLVILAILPGILFSSIYFQPDIRFTASEWIYQKIPSGSKILFDTGNVVDIPISNPKLSYQPSAISYQLTSFDFYHLDENYELFPKLLRDLEISDYIFVPSRRIFSNHMRLPEKFLLTAKYYELLFSGKLGFKEVQNFVPLTSKIFNDEQGEETFSVFDHPTIRIYKKTVKLTANDYENLFR